MPGSISCRSELRVGLVDVRAYISDSFDISTKVGRRSLQRLRWFQVRLLEALVQRKGEQQQQLQAHLEARSCHDEFHKIRL